MKSCSLFSFFAVNSRLGLCSQYFFFARILLRIRFKLFRMEIDRPSEKGEGRGSRRRRCKRKRKTFCAQFRAVHSSWTKALWKREEEKNRYIPTMHLTTYCHTLRSAIKEAVKFMCQLPFNFDFSILVSLDASEELVGAQLWKAWDPSLKVFTVQ